jgi:hypothetical protein
MKTDSPPGALINVPVTIFRVVILRPFTRIIVRPKRRSSSDTPAQKALFLCAHVSGG